MNMPCSDRRVQVVSLVIASWLVALSIIVFTNHKRASRLASESQRAPEAISLLHVLDVRLAAVEKRLDYRTGTSPSVSVERFEHQTQSTNERLTRLEQRPPESVSQDAFEALTHRLTELEASRARPAHPSKVVTQTSGAMPSKSDSADPPFRLVGLERRGGETFLTIAPPRAVSLAEMSVLRVGDIQNGWQLESIDTQSVTFRFQGQVHHLSLP